MRKVSHPSFRVQRTCIAGAAFAFIFHAATGFAAGKAHAKPHLDADAEEFDRPGDWAEWMHSQRSFPLSRLPDSVYLVGWEEWRAVTQASPGGTRPFALPAPPQWQPIGPAGLDYAGSGTPNMGPAAGRMTAFVLDPTNPTTMYAGFALGGVWKSTDGGGNWTALTDVQPSLAIGALVVDATNPMIVYAGTGEGNYSGDSFYGQGILKSTNGGTSWSVVGGDTFKGLSVARMFSDPNGALYVGTVQGVSGTQSGCMQNQGDVQRRGLYKSTDGGANWTQLVKGQSVTDFDIDTTSMPRTGFLTEYKVGAFRFDEATTPPTLTPIAGLPSATSNGPIFRIELARSKSNPMVMYAGVGIDDSMSPSEETGHAEVYRSMDGGSTWSQIANAPDYCADQCMYDNVVEIDPTNPAIAYFGGSTCSVYKLTNGTAAANWSVVSLPAGNQCTGNNWLRGFVHSDAHAIAFLPSDANTVFVASDGGLAKTTNGGGAWTHLNTGVSTLQFYDICVDPNDDTLAIGGLQDNGFAQRPSTGTFWRNFQTGDGTTCVMNLGDPTAANRFMLSTSQFYAVGYRTSLTAPLQQSFVAGPNCMGAAPCGEPTGFVAPLVNDPSAPRTVYAGTNKIYRSTTGGATQASWRAISGDLTSGQMIPCTTGRTRADVITAIAVAPSSSQRIYVGAYTGRISTSGDGGTTWNNVTKAPLPGRFVSSIAVDPTKPEVVYVSFSGFSMVTPNSPGHIYRSTDAGATWSRFDMGLDPLDLPVTSVRTHDKSSDIVYAGHDLGVVATGDGGKTWETVGTGFPNVAVSTLRYYAKGTKLYAATHGRSAWSIQFTPGVTAVPAMLTFTTKPGVNPAPQTLTVVNADHFGTTLQFNTAVAAAGAWASLNPTMGSTLGATGMPLTVSVTVGTMGIGEYDTSITVTGTGATPAMATVPVHLSITSTGIPPDAGSDASVGSDGGMTTTGGAGATGAGGSTGAGGAVGTGGTSTGATTGTTTGGTTTGGHPPAGDDSGCGCRVSRPSVPVTRALLALGLALALGWRRRKAPRAS
jgi:MYXO-CTERM domain-containing protein